MIPISPLSMATEDLPHRERMDQALVSELYSRARPAILTLIFILAVLWHFLGDAPRHQPMIRWVFGYLGLIILARLTFHLAIDRDPTLLASTEARHHWFIAGTFSVGVGYAALISFAYPVLTPAQFALLAMSITGINSGALISMALSPAAYAAYFAPSIGALAWQSILRPVPGFGMDFILLLAIYTVAMMALGLHVHRTMRDGILANLRVEQLALRDALTGLRNRRFLSEFMEGEWSQILRLWHPDHPPASRRGAALLVLDIDHFKLINDNYGHAAGDAVLRTFSDRLTETVRQPDLVVRLGGEEFVVVARDTALAPPHVLAERLRKCIAQAPFTLPNGTQVSITCSVGYAPLPLYQDLPHHLDWSQVLNLADGALYEAKQTGRNRSVGALPGAARNPASLASVLATAKDLEPATAANAIHLV